MIFSLKELTPRPAVDFTGKYTHTHTRKLGMTLYTQHVSKKLRL